MRAWLEKGDGTRVNFESNCYFGRHRSNTVQINSNQVSNRHAHIHVQQSDTGMEFWLADLGSTNGTLRNGKRVIMPCRLMDGDVVSIVQDSFTFRCDENTGGNPTSGTAAPLTVPVIASPLCWLLMLDIKAFTQLSRDLPPDQLSLKVGTWVRRCRDTIEGSGGIVDKLLGDAIFAYWKHGPEISDRIAGILQAFQAMQRERAVDFRVVLHHARTTMVGGEGGANNLSGPEVIYVFRMEKVAATLKTDLILSEPACRALGQGPAFTPLGAHELGGFAGTHSLFTLAGG
jgi:class 3 adenylate cyclase